MLESIFILLFVIAIIIFLLGIKEDIIAYYVVSLVIFLVLFISALGIEIPYIIASNTTTYTTGSHVYSEGGISALCLIFVFIDAIMMLVHWLDLRKKRQGPAIPGR
jgi:hypothetical protein